MRSIFSTQSRVLLDKDLAWRKHPQYLQDLFLWDSLEQSSMFDLYSQY